MKNLMSITGFVAFCFVISALATGDANADMIMNSDTFTNVTTELNDEGLTVDLFDGSLGMLTKVTVMLNANLMSAGTVTNVAQQAQDFSVETRASSFTSVPVGGAPASLPILDPFAPFSLIHSEAYVGVNPNDPQQFGPGGADGVNMFMTTNPGDLAQFAGPGTFTYLNNTSISTIITGGGGNVIGNIMTDASATLKVTYEFDPINDPPTGVPEPSTNLLMVIGTALGLGFASRRRRRR